MFFFHIYFKNLNKTFKFVRIFFYFKNKSHFFKKNIDYKNQNYNIFIIIYRDNNNLSWTIFLLKTVKIIGKNWVTANFYFDDIVINILLMTTVVI